MLEKVNRQKVLHITFNVQRHLKNEVHLQKEEDIVSQQKQNKLSTLFIDNRNIFLSTSKIAAS